MHPCYFHDNVVFFRVDSIRSPGLGRRYRFLFRSPSSWPKRNVNAASLLMLPTDRPVLEALTLSSRHRRRTDRHSMTTFREERQDMVAETNIFAEQCK
jgi:hypothetical protein